MHMNFTDVTEKLRYVEPCARGYPCPKFLQTLQLMPLVCVIAIGTAR